MTRNILPGLRFPEAETSDRPGTTLISTSWHFGRMAEMLVEMLVLSKESPEVFIFRASYVPTDVLRQPAPSARRLAAQGLTLDARCGQAKL